MRLSAGGILNSQFLDPILCQFVGRSRNMFALLILTATASAQDYCAITPKHTACGQKVKLKCFDCKKISSLSVTLQLGILNPSAKLSGVHLLACCCKGCASILVNCARDLALTEFYFLLPAIQNRFHSRILLQSASPRHACTYASKCS